MTVVAPAARRRRVPQFVKDLGVVAVVAAALLGVVAVTGYRALDHWRHRNDIGVDFDPEHHPAPIAPGIPRTHSPGRTRFAVPSHGRMVVVDRASQEVLADLGTDSDVGTVMFVDEDLLVAFGPARLGTHDGMAVIDLAVETFEQVHQHGLTNEALHPLRLTADGQILACEMHQDYLDGSGCGPERFLLDPTTADLTLAPWSAPDRSQLVD